MRYTGDVDTTKEQIIFKVRVRPHINPLIENIGKFFIDPGSTPDSLRSLHFVFLNLRYLFKDATWPMLTLLERSLRSMYLAWEAISELIPDPFIST